MRRSVALILMVLTVLLLGYGDEVPVAFKSRKLIDYLGEMFQASSTLEEEEQDYRMQNLFDGYAGSAWVEGKEGAGLGESLILAVPRGADTLALVNGFARSSSLYLKNNRIKELSLTVERGYSPEGHVTEQGPLLYTIPASAPVTVTVKDTRQLQILNLSLPWEEIDRKKEIMDRAFEAFSLMEGVPGEYTSYYLLRMEVQAVYPGSRWDDTCLSEIRIFREDEVSVSSVEARNGMLYYRLEEGPEKVLYRDPGLILDLLEASPDRRWCIAYGQYIDPERMRETAYLIFRLPYPAPWHSEEAEARKREGRIPTGFSQEEERLFLEWDDGSRTELEVEGGSVTSF